MTRPAHATDADARAAQALLDSIGDVIAGQTWGRLTPAAFLELRGILTGFAADVRAAGYLEGVQEGRREAAHVVVDALRGEGLAL